MKNSIIVTLLCFLFLNPVLFSQPDDNPPGQCTTLSCDSPYDYTFTDNQNVSGSYTNKKLYLEGNIVINYDASFNCCTFVTSSGSKITINEDVNMSMVDCSIYCGSWDGIYGIGNNQVNIVRSYFTDFTVCISLVDPNGMMITNNSFIGGDIGLSLNEVNATGQPSFIIAQNYFYDCDRGIEAFDCYYLPIGNESFDNNNFVECDYGIWSENNEIIVERTLFNSCGTGLFANGSSSFIECHGVYDIPNVTQEITFESCDVGVNVQGDFFSQISRCIFYNTRLGIATTGATNTWSLINNNNYEYNNPGGINNSSGFIFSVRSDIDVIDNEITRGEGGYGIKLTGPANMLINYDNLFESEGGALNYIINSASNINTYNTFKSFATYFDACYKTQIYDNNIYGGSIIYYPDIPNPSQGTAGIALWKCSNSTICRNIFDGDDDNAKANQGLSMFDDNSKSEIANNTFQNWKSVGMEINANIKKHYHKGNIWPSGTNDYLDALYYPRFTDPGYDPKKFYVNSAITGFYPETTEPDQSEWIVDEVHSTNSCDPLHPSIWDENDDAIVADTFLSDSYFNEWYQTIATFEMLLDDPDLLNDSIINNFYEDQLGTDIEYVVKAWKCLRESTTNTELDTTIRQACDSLLSVTRLLNTLEADYYEDPDAELLMQKASLKVLYDSLHDIIIDLKQDLNEYKISKIEDATDYNELISGENDLTVHEQFINGLIISKMLDIEFELTNQEYDSVSL